VALNNAAWTKLHAGDKAAALGYAQRAYFLSPSAETEDTLGWLLEQNGQSPKALTLLEQAATAKPAPEILYHYAVALQAEGHGKDARAALVKSLASKASFDERGDAQALLDKLPQ
jgi:tetratricopeptide (TPR) repeat protein